MPYTLFICLTSSYIQQTARQFFNHAYQIFIGDVSGSIRLVIYYKVYHQPYDSAYITQIGLQMAQQPVEGLYCFNWPGNGLKGLAMIIYSVIRLIYGLSGLKEYIRPGEAYMTGHIFGMTISLWYQWNRLPLNRRRDSSDTVTEPLLHWYCVTHDSTYVLTAIWHLFCDATPLEAISSGLKRIASEPNSPAYIKSASHASVELQRWTPTTISSSSFCLGRALQSSGIQVRSIFHVLLVIDNAQCCIVTSWLLAPGGVTGLLNFSVCASVVFLSTVFCSLPTFTVDALRPLVTIARKPSSCLQTPYW